MFGIYPKSFSEINNIIAKCLSINEVIIYGSRAKGDYKEVSDIDITLLERVNEKDIAKLWYDLNDSHMS